MKYLITGANRGIGLEFVRQLSERGEQIVATARRPRNADKLQSLADRADRDIEVLELDVTDDKSVRHLKSHFKGSELDIAINNAGQLLSGGEPGDINYRNIQKSVEVNTEGPLKVIDAVLPALQEADNPKIVNITSKMGSIADNRSGGSYAYRISKAGLNMATRSLAQDLKSHDVVAFVLHPGWVKTDMGGQNALITPEQSVENMIAIIDDATKQQTGTFLEWNGNEVPW